MANLISRISLFALFLVAIIAYVANTGQAAKGPIITNKVRVLPTSVGFRSMLTLALPSARSTLTSNMAASHSEES
jgi:hypothetical protein